MKLATQKAMTPKENSVAMKIHALAASLPHFAKLKLDLPTNVSNDSDATKPDFVAKLTRPSPTKLAWSVEPKVVATTVFADYLINLILYN